MAVSHFLLVSICLAVYTGCAVGLRCMECDGDDPTVCDQTTECEHGDACFIREFITPGGLVQFKTGCMSATRCQSGRRSLTDSGDLVNCMHCCSADFCNIEGCGKIATKQPARGPLCFKCDHQNGPDNCRDVVGCDVREKCILQQSLYHRQLLTSGCASYAQCEALTNKITQEHACTTCCKGDFCNDHCQYGASTTSAIPTHTTTVGTMKQSPTTTFRTASSTKATAPLQSLKVSTLAPSSTTQQMVHNTYRGTQSTTNVPSHTTYGKVTTFSDKPSSHRYVTTAKPNTPGKITTVKPSTHGQVTTAEPATHGKVTTGKLTTPGHVSTSKPTGHEHVTTVKPTTHRQVTTAKPTGHGKETTVNHTTHGQVTTAKPTTHGKVTTASPPLHSTTVTDVPPTDKHDCPSKQPDLIFLLDNSVNCPKETLWNSQIHFVDRLLNKFTIGNGGARVSVVKYSSDTREVVSLDEHLPKDQIMDKLRHTTYAGHHPNMHKGLQYISQHVTRTHNGDAPVDKYVIVLACGLSHVRSETLKAAAELKTNPMVTVFAIGLTPYKHDDHTELKAIASDSPHMFVPIDLNSTVQFGHITNAITASICHDPPCKGKEMDVCFVLDVSGSQRQDEFRHMLEFTAKVMGDLDVGHHGKQRICVVVLGAQSAMNSLDINHNTPKLDIIQRVLNITYSTNASESLSAAIHSMHSLNDREKHVVVLTDGQSSRTHITKTFFHQLHTHASPLDVTTIGIGDDVDRHELLTITADFGTVMTTPDFNSLDSLKHDVVTRLCHVQLKPATKPPHGHSNNHEHHGH